MVLEFLVKVLQKACWFLGLISVYSSLDTSFRDEWGASEAAFAQYFFWDNAMKILKRISQDFEDCGSGLQHLNPTHGTLQVPIILEDNYINQTEVFKLTLDLLKLCISTDIMWYGSFVQRW